MRIDVRLLRHAHALATHRSFVRAAEALHVSQPSLSRGIKALEEQVGTTLFVRTPAGVDPTDFGHLFLEKSFEVIARLGDLEREVALAVSEPGGDLSIGVGPYVAESLAPIAVSRLAASYPGVRIHVVVGAWETLAPQLRRRTCEFVVGETSLLEQQGDLELLEAFQPQLGYVVVRAGHPLTARREVRVADALAYPYAQVVRLPPRVLNPLLASRGVQGSGSDPKAPVFPAIECPSVDFALEVVARSDAFTLATLESIQHLLKAGQVVPILHEPWITTRLGAIRLRDRALSPAGKALLEEFRRGNDELLRLDASLDPWAWRKPLRRRRTRGLAAGAQSRPKQTSVGSHQP